MSEPPAPGSCRCGRHSLEGARREATAASAGFGMRLAECTEPERETPLEVMAFWRRVDL